jgi:hypothetical protein
MDNVRGYGFCIQPQALEALQEATEALIVTEFECKSFLSIILSFVLI